MSTENKPKTDAEIIVSLYQAGYELRARLEHWIRMNSGICDPKDLAAIDAWKEITE